MYVKTWVALVFAGVAIAAPRHTRLGGLNSRSTQDTPAIRMALSSISIAVVAFDDSLKQVTAENAATSLKDLNQKAHALGSVLESAAKSISASPPLKGVQDAIGLITPGKNFTAILNSTYQDINSKLEIIKHSKQTELVVDALRAQKSGLIALSTAIVGQVPDSMKSQAVATTSGITSAQLDLLFEGLLIQVASIMGGTNPFFPLLPSPSSHPSTATPALPGSKPPS